MASLSRLLTIVGMWWFASGPIGFGKIWVLGLTPGLGLTLFLILLFLVVKDPQTQSSQISVKPHLIHAEFRKAWMPFFCRSGHPVVTVDQFLDLIGHLLPLKPHFDFPWISGRDLQEVAKAKKSTSGGLDGWAWNELKTLPLPWFSGLAILLELLETTGVWPQGLLDACIAIIPKRLMVILPLLVRGPLLFNRLYIGFCL